MTGDVPYLYHPVLGGAIHIQDELSFRIAKIIWDAIAEKYEPTLVPSKTTVKDPTYEEIERERDCDIVTVPV